MAQPAVQLGARIHRHPLVMDIAVDPRARGQFDLLGGVHVAVQAAADDHHLGTDLTLDHAMLGDRQGGTTGAFGGNHLAVDAAFHVQATTEFHITADHHLVADQGIHHQLAITVGFAVSEHLPTPLCWPARRPVSSRIPGWYPPYHSPMSPVRVAG
ncbi:hypothetical protein G6F24_016318 [Rhizopus arrhizus]|nr:hypothetical protein G6F24_016318 [Rhizopus arrhizus]